MVSLCPEALDGFKNATSNREIRQMAFPAELSLAFDHCAAGASSVFDLSDRGSITRIRPMLYQHYEYGRRACLPGIESTDVRAENAA